jgi:hypothetical protein
MEEDDDDDDAEDVDDYDAEDDGSDDGYSSHEQQQPPRTPQRSAAPQPSASRASSRGANLWGVPPHAWGPPAEWATAFAPASQQWLRQQQQQHNHHQQQQQHRHKASRQQQQQGQQPAFFAAAAAPATSGAAPRHIPVRAAATAPAAAHTQRQQVPVVAAAAAPAAAAPVPAAAPARPLRRQLSEAEAATIIQSCWRGHRLAQQHAALTALGAASRQLRELAGKLASAGGVLSHKQYLELNELAMRVLLQLDATPCGPAEELRAVRKRLAKEAVALLDRAQQAFNATVTASIEPGSVVQQALGPKEQQQQKDEEEAAAGAGGSCASEAATEPLAVVVRLVCAGQMCEAATQTD